MKYLKKSLGQNFLIDKNIIKKIVSLTNFENKNIIEIGPGKGILTDEILTKKPKSLIVIEKDDKLANDLNTKYSYNKIVKVINEDFLKFNLDNIDKKNLIIVGNLPYNISSQILVKILKKVDTHPIYKDIILMFQKELGEKIIAKYPSKHYGRLSIITSYKLKQVKNFFVSANCFFPKPKVTSIVIHFKVTNKISFKIKKLLSLEKITNIIFYNKRKMINKNILKILSKKKLEKIPELNLKLRPENIPPEIYYKITELYEKD